MMRKDIYTLNEKMRKQKCSIFIKDAVGNAVDDQVTTFNITQIEHVSNQNNNEKNNSNSSNNNQDVYEPLDCKSLCPELFDFVCFVAHACWSYFARTAGIILIIVLISIVLIKYIKKGICRCIDKIVTCWCFDEKKKGTRQNKSKV